MKTQRLRVLS